MAERRIINGYIVERQSDGRLVTIGPAGGTAPQMPANPTFPYEGPKAAADLTGQTLDNRITEATLPAAIRKANADAAAAEAAAEKAQSDAKKGPSANPETIGAAKAKIAAARQLRAQLQEVERLFSTQQEGQRSIWEYAPSEQNKIFDKAVQGLMPLARQAFRVPGSGADTDKEAQYIEGLMPDRFAFDGTNRQAIDQLYSMLDAVEQEYGPIAGEPSRQEQQGAIAPAGNIPPAGGNGSQGPDRSNPLPTGPSFGGPQGDPSGFVPYGSTTRRVNNPEWAGVNEAVKGMIIAGQTPDQIRAYLGQRGINTNVEGLNQAADYFRKTGKRDFRVNVDDIEVPMSGFEQFRNNAPQTAVGAGLTTAANAASFGIPQALAPEQMQYIRDQSPVASFVGDVAGIVGATSGIGAVGNSLARSLAPRALTGGGRFGNAVRSVAPDAVYGAAYGGITEGDPLTGAATAAAGSGAGQLLGKGLQKGFQGVSDPAVQYLTARGVPLSLGETLGNNSIVGRQMQRMESIPILGDLMSARRGEARDAVYRGVLEDAVQPIGGRIDPADPLASAQQAISGAYDNAVGNVTVPLDARYFDELGNARNAASTLPPDLKGKFDAAMASRVDPLIANAAPSLDDIRALANARGVDLSVYEGPRGISLSKIVAAERNAGNGSQVMDALANYADATGQKISLTPSTDFGGSSIKRLQDYYSRFGFVKNAGRNKDYAISDAMYREPSAIENVTNAGGEVTGQQYQQAMRGLSGYKSEATKPGFEQDYRDAISMVQDALKGQMMRGGGDTVVTGLRNADQAYSMLKPIQNATISARGTPTPKQLQAAFTTNTKKFGGDAAAARGDKVPDIVRYAVNNAPNIGNSGTADRLAGIMPFIMPTALGGSAVGLETFTDSPFLTGSLATLAALSTRTGQKAMQTALVKRPAAVRRAGGIFGRRKLQKGLGASVVTAPLLVEQ